MFMEPAAHVKDENWVEEGLAVAPNFVIATEAKWRDLWFPTSGAKARQIWGTLD
jgi:hypothetical protein